MEAVVGWTLVAGFVVFMVGAAGWRMAYEQPLPQALPVIAADRRRRAWIHGWMLAGVVLTTAGLAGAPGMLSTATARGLGAMATTVYALGAVCWIASLAFRLTVVPWAAERTRADNRVPDGFAALDAWASALYVVHMASAYVAFVVLGAAVLTDGELPGWVGWLGVGYGGVGLVGFAATRAAGPFNPPFNAHVVTLVLGVVLLLG